MRISHVPHNIYIHCNIFEHPIPIAVYHQSNYQFEAVAILNDTAVNLIPTTSNASAHHHIIANHHATELINHQSSNYDETQMYTPISTMAATATPTKSELIVTASDGIIGEDGHDPYDSPVTNICKIISAISYK